MFLQMLENEYATNEPIFLGDIKSYNQNTLRQKMKRLVDDGSLKRFDNGVYYLPQKSKILGREYFDINKVVVAKYIKKSDQIFGYYSGLTFANQIGISSQVPVQKEIVSNKEKTNGRVVEISSSFFRLKKSRINISTNNWQLLQLLDLINDIEKWSEISKEEEIERLRNFITEKKLRQIDLQEYISYYPDKVAKRLIESGLIYVFT